jgi:hypothetical protein
MAETNTVLIAYQEDLGIKHRTCSRPARGVSAAFAEIGRKGCNILCEKLDGKNKMRR